MPKSNKPFFSIITCTKNSEKYLKNALDSVENQTYKNYEHIFVDGKSNDKTISLLESYKKNNNLIEIKILSKTSKGIANAMNEGIKVSKGKYIFILHSDDGFYDNDVLKDVAVFLEARQNLDWIYGKICVIEKNKKNIVGFFPTRWVFQQSWHYLLKFFNFIPHQSVFIKKEVFLKNGYFREDLKTMMDQEYWLRINYQTNWKFFNRTISNYRIHEAAQSSSKKNYQANINEYIKIQNKYINNPFEKILAQFINFLVEKVNKTVR
ncbi:MAG: hypothetical protein A2182_03165 [Candidatus Pacebacteria bacterium RIFOXYA1_FULL_38_18]|nr:MAG: hypothetical protein A2182_03165 [Candidatus Pacebacteria bacterium RIFOXYA1_FULL_38_18]OGJ39472.1 MAG: hypothetical protein A2411_01805 [Candidatus Pacebacteria bacterium RIFOXYC1_FULL_39_21]